MKKKALAERIKKLESRCDALVDFIDEMRGDRRPEPKFKVGARVWYAGSAGSINTWVLSQPPNWDGVNWCHSRGNGFHFEDELFADPYEAAGVEKP